MGLWSWLTGSTEALARPEPAASAPAAVAPPRPADPGWRSLPPVQRTLGDGVQPSARFGDFAGSLATWQNPRMLTELEHGRGPAAPAGSVTGIVDAVAGAAPVMSMNML